MSDRELLELVRVAKEDIKRQAAAMRGSANHKEGYAKAKAALCGFGSLVKIGA